jgi:hypothetical protein
MDGSGGSGASAACEPPDMLMLLDRTATMRRTPLGELPADPPAYASSKWHQAISAIEQVAAPPLDQGLRFGLELWPRDPGGDACTTLDEALDGQLASNSPCEAGEIVVEPGLGTGAAIQRALDPATTKICASTPTGNALLTASDYLVHHAAAGRSQYVVLVTDGADWDVTCPQPEPLPIAQQLAASGIKTYVVGFFDPGGSAPDAGFGVGTAFLNDMACAGQTANGFPDACTWEGSGYIAADPDGPALYFQATSADELAASLKSVASGVCCDCPPA